MTYPIPFRLLDARIGTERKPIKTTRVNMIEIIARSEFYRSTDEESLNSHKKDHRPDDCKDCAVL